MVEREPPELESVLGHHFSTPGLLRRALTHSSCRPELDSWIARDEGAIRTKENNEKLEFLGDAILGLLVSEELMTAFPDWSEGQLSKSRAKLVNSGSLFVAARRLGLGRYLRLGRGEEKTGGRNKPALLADAYEAVLAAIYLDAGLDAAREFVRRSLLAAALGKDVHHLGVPDHKSGLQEYLQARGLPPAQYDVIGERGPSHQKLFIVQVLVEGRPVASARGTNKKEAEQAAARVALEHLLGILELR
jgi:ribonuclease III